jgi:hypothetical protein
VAVGLEGEAETRIMERHEQRLQQKRNCHTHVDSAGMAIRAGPHMRVEDQSSVASQSHQQLELGPIDCFNIQQRPGYVFQPLMLFGNDALGRVFGFVSMDGVILQVEI